MFSYKLKGNGTAIISGFDWKSNGENDVYVPRLIDGYTVTEIGESAFSDSEVSAETRSIGQSVVIVLPDTITVIGNKAFFCTNITAVTIQ